MNVEDVPSTLKALYAALAGVQGLRVDRTGVGSAEPPAITVGPPTFEWDGYAETPTGIAIDAMLYMPNDEHLVARLLTWLPLVREAIETVEGVVVTTATPEPFRSGAVDLPAYRIHIEVA